MGSYFTMVACVFRGLGEFLLHLLWLAISEGLTVDFFRSEIQMIRAKVNEHSDGPESPKTEKFPDYDDPYYNKTHPFWREGWYDTSKKQFVIYTGS